MAWPFKSENDPEATPDTPPTPPAGDPPKEKTPAELIAESVNAALSPFTQKMDELSQKVDAATQRRQPTEPPKPNEPVSVLDDENAAFAQRMTPLIARQLELEARVVKGDIKREYEGVGFGDLWTQYEKQINETLDQTPLVTGQGKPFRGDPDYIRNAVDMIFGRAARQAGMRFDGKNKSFFLESASGAENARGKAEETDGMTPDQLRVFKRMGVPLDKAKETLKKMTFIH